MMKFASSITQNYYFNKLAIAFLSLKSVRNNYLYRYFFKHVISKKIKGCPENPPILLIENTNACNANCIICSRDLMTRDIGFMDFELFKKLVDESAKLGCKSIKITGFGEPFTDKNIFEKIKYVKSKGIPYVCLFTNGSLLEKEHILKILDSGLDEIFFSIDTGIKHNYEKIRRGLSFEKTDSAVLGIQHLKQSTHAKKPKVSINAVNCGNGKDISSLYQRYEKIVDRISVQIAHNWTSDQENISTFKNNNDFLEYPCPYPYFYMMIRYNGDISICCFDYDSKTILGNVKEQSLKSLWEGAATIKIRKLMEQGDRKRIKACSQCSQYPNWWANFD